MGKIPSFSLDVGFIPTYILLRVAPDGDRKKGGMDHG